MKLHINEIKWFEPGAESAARFAYTFSYCSHFAVLACEQGNNPIGFAKLVRSQHNTLVAIGRHGRIVSRLIGDCRQIRALVP